MPRTGESGWNEAVGQGTGGRARKRDVNHAWATVESSGRSHHPISCPRTKGRRVAQPDVRSTAVTIGTGPIGAVATMGSVPALCHRGGSIRAGASWWPCPGSGCSRSSGPSSLNPFQDRAGGGGTGRSAISRPTPSIAERRPRSVCGPPVCIGPGARVALELAPSGPPSSRAARSRRADGLPLLSARKG